MKLSKLTCVLLSAGIIAMTFPTQLISADDSTNKQTQTYSHGSSTTVTEDMLETEIPTGYDVNTSTQAKASSGKYSKLFDTENIQKVNLTINDNNWNYMLQNAVDKPNVLLDGFSVGDESISYASIKTKGNLTLNEVWQSTSDRFSFTVNFGKYIKKKNGYSDNQNFYGLGKVALNNIYGDASLMKEYLSYKLMTEMGIDTPYYSLINLYVNNEFYGVYLMVESIDSSLTQRTINEKSDFLVKPESAGGDLIYDSALDTYIDEKGNFVFTSSDYPTDSSNPLFKYNGLWENDKDTFADVVDMLPTVFKWMKTLNELSNTTNANTDDYKTTLSSIVNIDKLIRYFAVNTYLVNLDSYQSEKMQNYALYVNEDGYAQVFPWDYNYSFGGYGVSDASAMVNFSISNPVSNTTLAERPLLNVILQNDDYKALFNKYLKDCTTIASEGGTTSDGTKYDANSFATELDSYVDTLSESYAKDPTAFYTLSQYKTAETSLKQLISDRSTAVLKQLSGDTTLVETTVNLNSIGNVTGGGGGQPGGQPNGQGGQTSTLTDTATGITVSGNFPQDASLTVTPITSGTQYDSVSKTTSGTLYMYNVAVNMGNAPQQPNNSNSSTDSNAPQPPTDSNSSTDSNAPQPPTNSNSSTDSNAPQPPTNSNSSTDSNAPQPHTNSNSSTDSNAPQQPNGMQQSYTLTFPAQIADTEMTVYSVANDGTMTKTDSTSQDGKYTISTQQLGTYAVVYAAATTTTTTTTATSSESATDTTTTAATTTSEKATTTADSDDSDDSDETTTTKAVTTTKAATTTTKASSSSSSSQPNTGKAVSLSIGTMLLAAAIISAAANKKKHR